MYLKIILLTLSALVIHQVYRIYSTLDIGKVVYNSYPGPCHQVEGVDFGSENMHILDNGITFITSGYCSDECQSPFKEYYRKNNIKGRIFLFNLKNPQTGAQEMKLTSTKDFDRDRFRPHGISGWEDKKSGKLFLFVVNHERDGQERVEKFLVSMETLTLTHVKSYSGDPAFTLLNDVTATGEDSFYFTNMAYMHGIAFTLEVLAQLPWGSVGYYSGSDYKIVVDGLHGANGIHMSLDGRYIYVLCSGSRDLRIYERKNGNILHQREIYPFTSAPDNVIVDPVTSDLYLALHPVGHLAMNHLINPENKSPSQVLQVKLKDGSVSSVTQLFMDDRTLITGSAAAVVYNKKMLIGSVMDKLVYCDVKVPV